MLINSANQNRTENYEEPDQNQQKLHKVTAQDPGLGLLQEATIAKPREKANGTKAVRLYCWPTLWLFPVTKKIGDLWKNPSSLTQIRLTSPKPLYRQVKLCRNSATSQGKSVFKISLEMVRLAGIPGQNLDIKSPRNSKMKAWGLPVWSQGAGCILDAPGQLH